MATADSLRLPVGFRFHPTDVELVSYYLQQKIQGLNSHGRDIIADIGDICNFEPWDLPARSLMKSDDDEWFFFNRPEYIPNKGDQIKRSTTVGSWKITGSEKVIKSRNNRIVGKKRILTFYRGHNRSGQKKTKTNWVIHELYIPQTSPNAKQRDIFLCRLKKKSDEQTNAATCDEREPSTTYGSDVENQPQTTAHPMDIQVHYAAQENQDQDYFQRERDRLIASVHSSNDRLFDDSEEEFLKSVLDYPNQEEITHTTQFNDSTLPQSLWIVDAGPAGVVSSDTDTKQVPSIPVTHQGRTVRQSESVNVLMDTSIGLALDEYYTKERTRRTGYPRSAPTDAVKRKEPEKPKPAPECPIPVNLLKDSITKSERRTGVDLLQKDSMTKSKKDIKVTQGKDSEKDMKQTQIATASDWKVSSFISWETSPLTSPPSVYFFNALLGTILFMVFARELVLYGDWC